MNVPASVLKQLEAIRDTVAVAKRCIWKLYDRVDLVSGKDGPVALLASVVAKELQAIIHDIEEAEQT